MPLNGSGTYTPPAPEFPAIANTLIKSADFNAIINDIAAALSQAIFRDGQVAFVADQSMGSFKLRDLAQGVLGTDAVTLAQMQSYVGLNSVYLGGKAADPTVRNDGSALEAGDLYFNTATLQLKTWDGATWLVWPYTDANLVSFLQVGTGATARTVQSKLREFVSVKDFGVVGDWNGSTGTDDSAALQAALNAGPVIFPADCKVKVTGALTATHPIYMEDGACIQPTGSSYTVLTITPAAKSGPWRVFVGDGNTPFTGNGIVFGNPAAAGHTQIAIDALEVRKCAGLGLQVNNLWESVVGKLATYGCGNATNYAMEIRSNGSDSSNICSIQSIIVGQSDTLAFLGQIQFSRIAHLHIEETFTPAAKFFWLNKCVGVSYGKVRIYNAGSAQAWVGSTVQDFDQLDGDCTLVIDNTDAFGNEHVKIDNIYWLGDIIENSPSSSAAATCLVSVAAGRITTLTTGTSGAYQLGARWDVNNCDITALNIGQNAIGRYTRASMEAVKFNNCAIGTLGVTQAADCSFSLVNGTKVGAFSGTFTGSMLFDRAIISAAFAIQGDTASGANWYSRLYAYGSKFASTFSSTGNVVGEVINSTIDGNMSASTPATTNLGLVFRGTGCNGTVAAAFGATPNASDTYNQFGLGKRIDNIVATVGSPKGWICTVAGNPGTWVSEGNL